LSEREREHPHLNSPFLLIRRERERKRVIGGWVGVRACVLASPGAGDV
jgi:hypothetical protein